MSDHYPEQLRDILQFTGGRHILTAKEVRAYTGFSDNRTVKRHFPLRGGYISAVQLAAQLAGYDAPGKGGNTL